MRAAGGRHPSAARTSLLSPRAMAGLKRPNRMVLGAHEPEPSVAGRLRASIAEHLADHLGPGDGGEHLQRP